MLGVSDIMKGNMECPHLSLSGSAYLNLVFVAENKQEYCLVLPHSPLKKIMFYCKLITISTEKQTSDWQK